MIFDSSALVALLRDEPDAPALREALADHPRRRLAAPTLLETSMVIGQERHADLDALVERTRTEIVSFDATQARVARSAFLRYGRSSGSPARLNFGDCISYALATVAGEPLLFKGDDFTHTDVTSALPG